MRSNKGYFIAKLNINKDTACEIKILLSIFLNNFRKFGNTLRKFGVKLLHVKDKTSLLMQSDIVYSITCDDCLGVYIGQTGRVAFIALTDLYIFFKTLKIKQEIVINKIMLPENEKIY